MKRWARLLIIFWGSFVVACPAAPAQAEASPVERTLLGLVNKTRLQCGLRPLVWDTGLSRAARAHAERILREGGELEHQYRGEPDLVTRASREGARFSGVGENIARRARTPAELHAVWMTTPVHRSNILSTRWTSLGIGVVESRGLLYAVEDFADAGQGLTDAEIELAVGDALRRSGVPRAESSSRAREACQAGRDPEGAALVITWDGPEPTSLPPALLQRLAATSFRSAEVGVCPGRTPVQGFTTTRVAALLY